jgi:PAS domain S-box-containing protein
LLASRLFAAIGRILRLRGPLASDPTAKIFHALLVGVLAWGVLQGVVFVPRFIVRARVGSFLLALLIVAYIAALVLLRRGALREASLVYLGAMYAIGTLLIALSGGIYSHVLVLYVSIPISAAWLLGYRATLVGSALCLAASLTMAILHALGMPLPKYFPGAPIGNWSMVLWAVIIAAVPVMVVLRTLNESLAMAQRWISELRQAQDALRRERDMVSRIMDTSPAGIVAVNRDGRIIFANSSVERIYGVSRDEVTRRTYNDLAWRATRHDGSPMPDEEYPFRRVQASGSLVHHVPIAIERPDGRRVLLSVNAAPVPDEAGSFNGMVSALDDVTDRVRAEEELREHREHLEELVRERTEELVAARDQAMAASQAKSAFLANMSHELRTPLNDIIGFSRLLAAAQGVPAEHLEKIRIIARSGEHLLDLINDVLDMARIESGRFSIEISATDLNDLVTGVMEMMRVRAEEKSLELVLDRSPSFPRFVRTDAAKLRQTLINLIGNAVKYTERGGVTLRLDTGNGDRPRLFLEVADTGVGIRPEDQERIFQPFVQAGTPNIGGTGLGLAITRQYVELMGGAIGVESQPGRGSRFYVTLPLEIAESADVLADRQEAYAVIRLEPGQPRYRVLVVEDRDESRLLLQTLLRDAGFEVQTAANGAVAVEAFGSWHPHFVWMDWRMPVMDGRQATQHIRSMEGGRDVKIAAISASAFSEERDAILAAGVDDFLEKPFRPEAVFRCMARLLGVRYLRDTAAMPAAAPPLSPEALRVLPEALRAELADALELLDVTRVNESIRRLSEVDPSLGAALAQRAACFAFTPILNALEACRGCAEEEVS